MDDTRFDAWTRRRVGLAAGGFVASLLALVGIEAEASKKKKKKKKKKDRCRKLGDFCTPGGKQVCCDNRRCGRPTGSTDATRCCHPGGVPCTAATAGSCCTGVCREDTNQCFCKGAGQPCNLDSGCCSNSCVNGICV
jgi:hypothetical protein